MRTIFSVLATPLLGQSIAETFIFVYTLLCIFISLPENKVRFFCVNVSYGYALSILEYVIISKYRFPFYYKSIQKELINFINKLCSTHLSVKFVLVRNFKMAPIGPDKDSVYT